MSSDDYDFLLWAFSGGALIVPKGNAAEISLSSAQTQNNVKVWIRSCGHTSDTEYAVGNCYSQVNGSARQESNGAFIPLAIYGIKSTISLKITAIAPTLNTAADHCMLSDGVTSVEDALDAKEVSRIELVSVTATTGTGSGSGVANIAKSDYPNSKALIPFGVDTTLGYRTATYNETSTYYRVAVTTIAGQWASGVTLTFRAYVIY